jgi:valyl-tRNA synthetase
MSKSLNNIIDPLDMIHDYGTDALRLALVVGTTPGNDSKLSPVKIAGFKNFVNKIWNVSRYVLMSAAGETARNHQPSLADQWIKSRLALAVEQVTTNIEEYQYSLAAERTYDFLWHEFADWYVEIAKLQPNPTLTRHVLETTLKLLHPFVPFVTEAIWEKLHPNQLLMIETWPLAHGSDRDAATEVQFAAIQDIVTQVRNLRSQYKIAYTHAFALYHDQPVDDFARQVIQKFCRVEFMSGQVSGHVTQVINAAYHFTIQLGDLIDVAAERVRLQKELTELQNFHDRQQQKLANQGFIDKAPIEIVDKEKSQLAQIANELVMVQAALQRLD